MYLFLRRFFWPWIAFFGLTWIAFLVLCVVRLSVSHVASAATHERSVEIREGFCCLAIAGKEGWLAHSLFAI